MSRRLEEKNILISIIVYDIGGVTTKQFVQERAVCHYETSPCRCWCLA